MPLPGFKSITISADLYDRMLAYMEANKTELELKGIFSLSSLCVDKIQKAQEEQRKLRRFAEKIKTYPEVCRFLVVL